MIRRVFRDVKKPFLFLTAWFILSVWLGFYAGVLHPKESAFLFDEIGKDLGLLRTMSAFAIFLFIFLNNAVKSYAVMLLGTFFGIAPVIFIFLNGVLIGFASSVIIAKEGTKFLVLGTVPHGIFEIPAILIASAYGIELGGKFWRKLRYHEPFKGALRSAIKNVTRFVLPILLIASFIETFITAYLLRLF